MSPLHRIALAAGAAAAAAALSGHYRVLPAWLTGPEICRLEDGGTRHPLSQPPLAPAGHSKRRPGPSVVRLAGRRPAPQLAAAAAPRDDLAGSGHEHLPSATA